MCAVFLGFFVSPLSPLNTQCGGVTKECVLPIWDVLFSTFVFQPGRIRAVGIIGIERKLEEKRKETDKNISEVILTQVPVSCLPQPSCLFFGIQLWLPPFCVLEYSFPEATVSIERVYFRLA